MRLAIVEDDDKVRQQLQTYVLQYFQGRENDVEIRLFADGDEILEDYAADYDLIFLDIQMKRLDGLATAERIRERDEDVYLVFITNPRIRRPRAGLHPQTGEFPHAAAGADERGAPA